ncbi:envelope stress response activation lipoprotein NlpE [Mangrovibacter plantisponsor]|uniref:Copper homeostasis protein (Lipoprotein) n=1 Tax=Mangrovibacter plantisponsor TaxID=451513 RepID=A0A317Q1S2_9ENTR|nr:envelope stress response activation lipoprotein NlpE [Mangrovibacter plantisponsor]PWW08893.1 copper homeostasis protein (lipoprotein) [Mangrovibacter plantisponsor]
MRKIIIAVSVVLGSMLALSGCNNRAEGVAVVPAEFKPMQQSYKGVLPCADCGGIETSLFLEKDGSWVMQQEYQGRGDGAVTASWGTWARTANKLTLTATDGEKWYFHPQGDSLVMLDKQGDSIHSSLNYTLKPAQQALPVQPMPMRGLYKYMADTATFTDCATGKRFSVVSNIALERGYRANRKPDMEPVLVVLDAHFTREPNPDTGVMHIALVADSEGIFKPDTGCSTTAQQ